MVLPPDSAQGVYMKAIYLRLQSETTGEASRSAFQSKWLLDHLKANNWWVRAKKAKLICTKLGLDFSEPSYYRDIRVWIPDLEFGAEAMPPCVECKKMVPGSSVAEMCPYFLKWRMHEPSPACAGN